MTVLLLCGYQTSGKDTVYHDLVHESFWESWIVLSKPGTTNHIKFTYSTKYIRIAFADDLKEYVLKKYGLNPSIQKTDVIPQVHSTYRDLLIKESIETKKINETIWVESAVTKIKDNDLDICITDWRFPYELEYIRKKVNDQPLTARVFRKDVPIPRDDTEHQLDTFPTDIVILPNSSHIPRLVELFPQYKEYKIV